MYANDCFWKYKVCAYTRGDSSWQGPQMRVGLLTTAIFGDLSGYFFGNFRHFHSKLCWRAVKKYTDKRHFQTIPPLHSDHRYASGAKYNGTINSAYARNKQKNLICLKPVTMRSRSKWIPRIPIRRAVCYEQVLNVRTSLIWWPYKSKRAYTVCLYSTVYNVHDFYGLTISGMDSSLPQPRTKTLCAKVPFTLATKPPR